MTEEEIEVVASVIRDAMLEGAIVAETVARAAIAALDKHREGTILSDPERDRRNESKGLEGAGRPF